jgi:hypothetical protein
MDHPKSFVKKFPNGLQATAIRAAMSADPATLATTLKLPPATGLLLLFGGAGFMTDEIVHRLSHLSKAIAETLIQLSIAVMDGGTDAGVMALMGRALYEKGRKAPHIGVLPAKAEVEPGGLLAEDILEPHHSHFVLIDSDQWGAELDMMNSLADHLSGNSPSLALLVNGGEIALEDVESSVKRGREIIVVRGSGRLADEIAEALLHVDEAREAVKAIVENGRLTLIDLSDSANKIAETLNQRLKGDGSNEHG